MQVLAGGNWRSDAIDITTGRSVSRPVRRPTANLRIDEHNVAGFGQVQARLVPWLKLTGGARFDRFVVDVGDRLDPAVPPNPSPHALSPKAGVAVTPFRWWEIAGKPGYNL